MGKHSKQENEGETVEKWYWQLRNLNKADGSVKNRLRKTFPGQRLVIGDQFLQVIICWTLFGNVQCYIEIHEHLKTYFIKLCSNIQKYCCQQDRSWQFDKIPRTKKVSWFSLQSDYIEPPPNTLSSHSSSLA